MASRGVPRLAQGAAAQCALALCMLLLSRQLPVLLPVLERLRPARVHASITSTTGVG
jgi:hypothetical protein